MTINQAAALLRTSRIEGARPQIWCDLGCGEGVFTMALASLLTPGSIIHAVDMQINGMLDFRPIQWWAKLFSKQTSNSRMAYVAVSRGAEDAQLYTNDRGKRSRKR